CLTRRGPRLASLVPSNPSRSCSPPENSTAKLGGNLPWTNIIARPREAGLAAPDGAAHRLLHPALGFPLGDGLPLVVLLLAPGQGQFHLDPVPLQVHP